jgi:hypothetical protein
MMILEKGKKCKEKKNLLGDKRCKNLSVKNINLCRG